MAFTVSEVSIDYEIGPKSIYYSFKSLIFTTSLAAFKVLNIKRVGHYARLASESTVKISSVSPSNVPAAFVTVPLTVTVYVPSAFGTLQYIILSVALNVINYVL